ncbi:MAG: MoxR family ATPase [Trueperella sp.]|uniref:AAA family ATPase n=1 Tax=Trueperella sp. TaxID=2699835 RepID=UPI0025FAE8A5|nr:MoxR family ATPase [Trueperella sp.]MCI7305474.1 MoxR family ATPase [Trueperella sp.]MDY5402734.1 MoxR family ATPase [Trueperella sp.]
MTADFTRPGQNPAQPQGGYPQHGGYHPQGGYQPHPQGGNQVPGHSAESFRPPITQPAEEAPAQSDAAEKFRRIRVEIAKAIVGQDHAVTSVLIGLLCDGHVLLEGVPGTAKTLLVRSLAASLDLDAKRVQFTPDLMPGDLTGSLIYSSSTGEFSFRPGPVFTNLLIADEINRTPPKTQAALLEAMAERQVSVDGEPRTLADPFMVVATQNPVEYEGTYPLPEAQLDRFMLKTTLPLPPREVEVEILRRHAGDFDPADLRTANIEAVAGAEDVRRAREEVADVEVSTRVLDYIVDLVRATRVSPAVSLGVSPRGATALLHGSRAWAWLTGRSYVTPDDVKALAVPTLTHRIQLHAEAELDGVGPRSVIESILASVPVPR